MEDWLKSLKLSPASKAKIRNVMSMIFRHAIRWGWLGQQENPIVMVRVSRKRMKAPVVLTAEEFRALPDSVAGQRTAHGNDLCHMRIANR